MQGETLPSKVPADATGSLQIQRIKESASRGCSVYFEIPSAPPPMGGLFPGGRVNPILPITLELLFSISKIL